MPRNINNASDITCTTLDCSDGNISNVGAMGCDSIDVADTSEGLSINFGGTTSGENIIMLTDNLANALSVIEGEDTYLRFLTADSLEQVIVGKTLNLNSNELKNIGVLSNATSSNIPLAVRAHESQSANVFEVQRNDGATYLSVDSVGLTTLVAAKLGTIVYIGEKSAASVDIAGQGQLWVKSVSPNELFFTNDDGDDIQLTNGSNREVGAYIYSNAHCDSSGNFTNEDMSTTKTLVYWSTPTSSDTNILSYNSTGSEFTVKKAGTYEIHCRLAFQQDTTGQLAFAGVYILNNGSEIRFSGVGIEQYDSTNTYYFASVQFYYSFESDDVITIKQKQNDDDPTLKLYNNAIYGGEILIRSVSF